MKIIFTGASSFTGFWFVRELAENGHEVYATFTKNSANEYEGIRKERVKHLVNLCHPIWSCPFGSENFLNFLNNETFIDLFCHHASDVKDYKSLDFDFAGAMIHNTYNVKSVLATLQKKGCNRIVLTGSVFEQNEGVGEKPLRSFSPYGLSKGLTSEVFLYWCQTMGFCLGKFVIANPFGPFEEHRFTSYLATTWLKNELAIVRTPLYVRDNIHISLLAMSYRNFIELNNSSSKFKKINPRGYVESQGSFALRFASEMRKRFNFPCEIELGEQTTFDEPRMRVNTDVPIPAHMSWDEKRAWDDIASFYLTKKI